MFASALYKCEGGSVLGAERNITQETQEVQMVENTEAVFQKTYCKNRTATKALIQGWAGGSTVKSNATPTKDPD